MSVPLTSERVRVDVGELLTDIKELEIEIDLPVNPTASLMNDGRDVTKMRDLSLYNQHLASDSSDEEEEKGEEEDDAVRNRDAGQSEPNVESENANTESKVYLESFESLDEDREEDDSGGTFNEYIALEDDPDDQFSEFMSASTELSTSGDIITSSAAASPPTVTSLAPYDAYAPRIMTSAMMEKEQDLFAVEPVEQDKLESTATNTTVLPASTVTAPSIQPLTKGN